MTAIKTEKRTFKAIDLVLAAFVVFGVVLAVIRMVRGLGATTNLNSGYPWGMWIAFDVFTIPFSAVAFTLAAIVHIFNQEKYHNLSRVTVLAGFLGYLMVILILVVDINRWDQFYNVLLPWRWNLHSFMFEVALSITLYFGVLILEMLTIVFDKSESSLMAFLKRLIVLITAVGVLLSTVHQSSMGAVFVMLRHSLEALWWSPLLPVLFLTSALFTGLSVAIFLGVVTWRAMGRPSPKDVLTSLAKWVVILQVIYLVLKLGDLLLAGEIGLIFSSGLFSVLFLIEVIVGLIVPIAIFASKGKESDTGLVVGSVCTVVGILLNRWSIAWFALNAPPGATYSPFWMEWIIAITAAVAGVWLYSLAVRRIAPLRDTVMKEAH